jgi:hypothetical protein
MTTRDPHCRPRNAGQLVTGLPLLGVLVLVAGCGGGSRSEDPTAGEVPRSVDAQITISAPAKAATIRGSRVVVRGAVAPVNARVQVMGVDAAVRDGVFRRSVPLSMGANSVDVVASGPGLKPSTQTLKLTRGRSLAAIAAARRRAKARRAAARRRAAERRVAEQQAAAAPEPAPDTAASGSGYPQGIRDNFLAACQNQINATAAGCRCSLEYLEAHVSVRQFELADAAIRTGGTIPQWFYDAAAACA